MTTLYIKNMVCARCILVVKAELAELEPQPMSVELGLVTLKQDLTQSQKSALALALQRLGFELIDDKKTRLVTQVKTSIINLVHHHNTVLKVNLSQYLAEQLQQDYPYLSSLFSELEGTTIEKYFIAQKVEKVKELLDYNEQSLSEIAFALHYSSVAHLSNQFKKVTGITPSQFKNNTEGKRKALDKV